MKHTYKQFDFSFLVYKKEGLEKGSETPIESQKLDGSEGPAVLREGEKFIDSTDVMAARVKVKDGFNTLVNQVTTLPAFGKDPEAQLQRRFNLGFVGLKWKRLLSEFKSSNDFKMVASLRTLDQKDMPLGAVVKGDNIFRLAYSYETGRFQVKIEKANGRPEDGKSESSGKKENLFAKLGNWREGRKKEEARLKRLNGESDTEVVSASSGDFMAKLKQRREERRQADLKRKMDEAEG